MGWGGLSIAPRNFNLCIRLRYLHTFATILVETLDGRLNGPRAGLHHVQETISTLPRIVTATSETTNPYHYHRTD
jgi:hypothetical protein